MLVRVFLGNEAPGRRRPSFTDRAKEAIGTVLRASFDRRSSARGSATPEIPEKKLTKKTFFQHIMTGTFWQSTGVSEELNKRFDGCLFDQCGAGAGRPNFRGLVRLI